MKCFNHPDQDAVATCRDGTAVPLCADMYWHSMTDAEQHYILYQREGSRDLYAVCNGNFNGIVRWTPAEDGLESETLISADYKSPGGFYLELDRVVDSAHYSELWDQYTSDPARILLTNWRRTRIPCPALADLAAQGDYGLTWDEAMALLRGGDAVESDLAAPAATDANADGQNTP